MYDIINSDLFAEGCVLKEKKIAQLNGLVFMPFD